MTDQPALPSPINRSGQLAPLDALAAIPEEAVWLASQKSARTRRAYRLDVAHFMRFIQITATDALRQVDHRAVIAWERHQREQEGAAPSTVRRRLAALSSLFKHLVRHGVAVRNPVADVQRPMINRDEGSTLAFSKAQARKILDAPPADTLAGLRDRAILSVGLQVGFRRAEIAALKVVKLLPNLTPVSRPIMTPEESRFWASGCAGLSDDGAVDKWPAGATAQSLAQAGHLSMAVDSHRVVAEAGDQFRFLNRQLVLPVSMISQ